MNEEDIPKFKGQAHTIYKGKDRGTYGLSLNLGMKEGWMQSLMLGHI